ncbi:NAD-dependent epimerase/dehydratase family protein [Pollutimonas thiosulfatoxidans]|uniref:NAD-dependent epimerase/dehydratase family protein n=1 Tax=Pollutimonas thiosulfatoxidans TaxID=2028345 RepID=UPI0013E405E7|nr:NAD(P)-dependent oxidoreductase [Pollutimonas thiosulfatoxidans]
MLEKFANVVTAGRSHCDIGLDLRSPLEDFRIPADLDAIVNVASYFGGKSYEDIAQAQSVNVMGLMKLCEAATRSNAKHLVQISSIFAELDTTSHLYGAYSLTKRHSEEMAELHAAQFNLPLTILRPSQLYAVGDSQRKHQGFLYSLIDNVEQGKDVLIYGKNDALRNFIHTEDVAQIIALVIQSRTLGKYICASIQNVRLTEIANAAIEAFNSPSEVKFLEAKPNVPDVAFQLNDDIYRILHFYPQISLLAGMQKEAARRRKERENSR